VSSSDETVRVVTLALLAKRADDATVCPSEVARALADEGACEDWRQAMPVVHTAVDTLLRGGIIRLSWKGMPLETRSGPYRIAYRSSSDRES
jgi:hypothetical protein